MAKAKNQLAIAPALIRSGSCTTHSMKSELPKSRVEGRYGSTQNFIDYRYVNYDLKAVEADFEAVSNELSKAQTALDLVNSTESFEIAL